MSEVQTSTFGVAAQMTQWRSQVVPLVAGLLGLAMIGGGTMKLAGQTGQVVAFATLGLPAWFRALVGTFEVLGGILLIVPATSPIGSLILSTIMVGAVWAHVAHRQWTHLVPVIVLLVLFLSIFQRTRARAVRLLGGL